MLKAVIFDMDGVLIDSMPYHADAWIAVFARVGIKVKRDDIYKMEGSNHVGIIRMVFEKVGRIPEPEDFDKLAEEKKKIFSKINKATVFEGIYELIDDLKNKYDLAVVSGSDKTVVKELIEYFFPDIFSVMVTGNDVIEGKPSPLPYLKAVEMLKVRKDECIVIENAPLGVESAKRAGLYCIAIPTYVEPELLEDADIVLPDHARLKECISKFDIQFKSHFHMGK
ncbi:MAG: HAD family phosphatase [Candidatus Methanoperedens sp.]|nr:HAD family phosphatase [Candidatus Methanoperedens sp.]